MQELILPTGVMLYVGKLNSNKKKLKKKKKITSTGKVGTHHLRKSMKELKKLTVILALKYRMKHNSYRSVNCPKLEQNI